MSELRESANKCRCGHGFSLHHKRYGSTACVQAGTSEIGARKPCGCAQYEGAKA